MYTKELLIQRIRLTLGEPVVDVELEDAQISEFIDFSRDLYIKWATGNATEETFFTVLLSGGQRLYDMPVGLTNVLSYETKSGFGSINTLFTLSNYLYNQGLFDSFVNSTYSGFSLVSFHVVKDFLKTLDRYVKDKYSFKYHRYTNQLEIYPVPPAGLNYFTIPERYDNDGILQEAETVDSPGFLLVRGLMLEGSSLPGFTLKTHSDNLLSETWIFEYALALCMRTLGYIRRKYSDFRALGNEGISLDGNAMMSEAIARIEKLEERLRTEEPAMGWPILYG